MLIILQGLLRVVQALSILTILRVKVSSMGATDQHSQDHRSHPSRGLMGMSRDSMEITSSEDVLPFQLPVSLLAATCHLSTMDTSCDDIFPFHLVFGKTLWISGCFIRQQPLCFSFKKAFVAPKYTWFHISTLDGNIGQKMHWHKQLAVIFGTVFQMDCYRLKGVNSFVCLWRLREFNTFPQILL